MRNESGIMVLEILFAIVLVAFLTTSVSLIYIISLQGWQNLGHRSDLHEKISFGLDRLAREVSEANDLSVANHSLRFTVYESGLNQSFIYYLYHPADAWPPAYSQTSYNLMRTSLTGGISGTFVYGSGELIVNNLKPPGSTSITASGDVAILTLTGQEGADSITIRQRICARNK